MAFGDPSNPVRFAQGQTADPRALARVIFKEEVLTAFDLATVTQDKHRVIPTMGAKSIRVPKSWIATAEYHTPGVELLGNPFATTDVTITVDDILVAHFGVSDLDEYITHFEIRSGWAQSAAHALAKVYDKNVMRSLVLAARTAADGPFPGGTVITDAALTNSGAIDGKAWLDAIIAGQAALFNKDVPESEPRYMVVNKAVFDALKYAKDANGQYLLLNRDFGNAQAGGVAGTGESLVVEGVRVFPSRNMPSTDETSDTSVYTKYRANFATTTAIMWTPSAVATAKVADISMETARDTRRLEDFTVVKALSGSGTLRPECAVEFKTA